MLMGDVKFYAQVVGGPPCEKVLLESSLVIGSEVVGGLQVQHPHLSSEHCTLSLQSGVLSIIDHNSDLGVVVNGKKIPPNKMIIILPTDEIKLGDLILKIHSFEEEAISEDHKTKILSLDDLMKEDAAQSASTNKEDTQKMDLNHDDKDTTWKTIVLEKQSQGDVKVSEPVKKAEEVTTKEPKNIRETEKQMDLTQTQIKKDQGSDPLAKFKRGAKLHESGEKSHGDAIVQSKKNLQKFKGTSKKYYFKQFDSISFPLRIFALCLDLILGFRLSLFLMEKGLLEFFAPVDEFIQFSFDFVLNLHPVTAQYSSSVVTISPYLIGYIVLRVGGNVLFGASVGQVLIGCWNDGNFAIKRLLGPFRELLGFVLAPLLIFDMPALFSKKTVKEMLTMTGLECYSKVLSYILALILIPVSIVFSFFAPLILENDLVQVSMFPQSQEMKVPPELSSAPLSGSSFLRMHAAWNSSNYLTYTNFKLVKKDQSRIYVPKITLVSYPVGEEILRIERKKVFEWEDHVKELIKMYPILSHRFETLNNGHNKIADKNYNLELKQVIQDSFELSTDNLPAFILNYGPYLDPFLNFRKKLIQTFQGSVKNIEFWKNSETEFMVVYTNSAEVAGKWREFYIIPLSQHRVFSYQVSYLKDKLVKSKQMMMNFLSVAKMDSKIPNLMNNWKGAELNTAELLDFYSVKNLTPQDKAVMSTFLYRYYWSIAKNAASTNFDLFWADYTNVLQQVILMLTDLNAIERKKLQPTANQLQDVGYEHLVTKLSELREVVKNRQVNYFKVPVYP